MPSWADFQPFIVSGLALGGVYALSGVGTVVLYQATGVVYLAFGAVGPVVADQGSPGNCKGATVTLVGPNSLWPPNHKMVTEKLELSKYCRFCRKHTSHKEVK